MKNIIRTHPLGARLVISLVTFLVGINCLIIGNLMRTTTLMALGIISLPMSIIILNPLSNAAVKWIDETTEEQ